MYVVEEHKVTERRACRVLQVNRTAYRYEAIRLPDEDEVRADIIDKVCNYGRVGYRMVTNMMRNEGRNNVDVIYPGKHIRNTRDKSDTFTVEGVNADLRHYIPILARRSRRFPRSLETLRAVADVFADAYNRFGKQNSNTDNVISVPEKIAENFV